MRRSKNDPPASPESRLQFRAALGCATFARSRRHCRGSATRRALVAVPSQLLIGFVLCTVPERRVPAAAHAAARFSRCPALPWQHSLAHGSLRRRSVRSLSLGSSTAPSPRALTASCSAFRTFLHFAAGASLRESTGSSRMAESSELWDLLRESEWERAMAILAKDRKFTSISAVAWHCDFWSILRDCVW